MVTTMDSALQIDDQEVKALRDVEEPPSLAINFEKVRSTLIRNRLAIASTMVIFLLGAVIVTALMRPKYTAAASVQIEQQAAKVLGSEDADPVASYQDADRFLQTQVDVLRSRSLAERVTDTLHLDRDGAFVAGMAVKPRDPIPAADPRVIRREQVVELLMENLRIDLPRTSRVATISFVSPSPKLAQEVVNAFAQQFIVANLQRRFDATSYARRFVEGRLQDVRRRLENSERQVNIYARDAGLIDASNAALPNSNNAAGNTSAPRSLTLARLVQLNTALVTAQTERTEAEERWNQARGTPLMSLPEVIANSSIQELRQQRAQLAAAYEEEKQRRRDAYPTMIQQAARIAELDRQITGIARDVLRSIADSYRSAVSQERQTTADIVQLEHQARSEQDRGVRYNILRREVDTNRELYDGLLQRFKELSAQAGVTTNNISVVDLAELPRRPTSPKLLLNLALAALLGVIFSAAMVILRETFDDRVRLPEDVPEKLGLPLMASIPAVMSGSSPRQELDDPKSELSEAYQALRATLELSTNRGVPSSLLVTSSRPSEGKSTSAYAVARTFAHQGRSVVLIDLDLRRPSIHKTLGLENASGMSNLLSGQQSIESVVQATGTPNLTIVPSGPIPPNPAQLLDRDAIRSVLEALGSRFELVVIDAPPVLGLADTLELAAAAGGVLFVVESGTMHFGGVRSSINRLHAVHANLLGVILNKFDAKAVGYGSSYSYNYTYKYGSSEGSPPRH